MSANDSELTRTTFLRGVVLLPALAGLLTSAVAADDKIQQSAVQYQTKPNGGKQCSKCSQFIPDDRATADGTCKMVEGVISPNGYCIAYDAK